MPEFIRRWLYTHQIDSTLSGGSAPVLPAATMDTVGTDLENRFLMVRHVIGPAGTCCPLPLPLLHCPPPLAAQPEQKRTPQPPQDYTTGDTDTVEFPGHGRLAPQAALNLDGEDSPVMLKLTEMLCSKNASELSSLVHLAAQFRLMRLVGFIPNKPTNPVWHCRVLVPVRPFGTICWSLTRSVFDG